MTAHINSHIIANPINLKDYLHIKSETLFHLLKHNTLLKTHNLHQFLDSLQILSRILKHHDTFQMNTLLKSEGRAQSFVLEEVHHGRRI